MRYPRGTRLSHGICDTCSVCTVVWEGCKRYASPYPISPQHLLSQNP